MTYYHYFGNVLLVGVVKSKPNSIRLLNEFCFHCIKHSRLKSKFITVLQRVICGEFLCKKNRFHEKLFMTTSFTKDDSRDVVVTYGGKFEISRSLLPSWDIGHERMVGILKNETDKRNKDFTVWNCLIVFLLEMFFFLSFIHTFFFLQNHLLFYSIKAGLDKNGVK